MDAVAGGACVAPEFFKSWLSRPGAISQHVLHGSLESGKLAASVRASLGGVGAAPPAPNDAATSIPTASKAKARAKKAADATDKAAVPPPAESGGASGRLRRLSHSPRGIHAGRWLSRTEGDAKGNYESSVR